MSAYEIVVVGASLGGLHAISTLLARLPATFSLPMAVVQHRTSDSEDGLAAYLQRFCALPVVDAEDKQPIVGGQIYLAPAGYHLLVDQGNFALSTEAPVLSARPSIDVLFESAVSGYANRVIGVILTGASDDGAQGLRHVEAAGGLGIVQDPASAESAVMPQAAIQATQRARVLSLDEVAETLIGMGGR